MAKGFIPEINVHAFTHLFFIHSFTFVELLLCDRHCPSN